MIIDISRVKQLLSSDVSGYEISQQTGISQGLIGDYRNGRKNIENMAIKTAIKFMKFIENGEYIMKNIELLQDGQIKLNGGAYKLYLYTEVEEGLSDIETLRKVTDLDEETLQEMNIERHGKAIIILVDGEGSFFNKKEAIELDKLIG